MNSELYESIIKVFKETGSVLDTAHRLNTYPIKVRRVLITEGLWSSKSSRTIAKLLEEGKKVSEIAEELGITDKNVQAYMPYSKGEYGKPEKTKDAINIANYRKRNSSIAAKTKEKKDSTGAVSSALSTRHSKKRIMKLHLELELDEQCLPTLRKYGKVKNGISRDILAPSDMTLLALHYVIQRAFGWHEEHLHTFEIDHSILEKLTDNSFKKWWSFCGLYVRDPFRLCDDYFWDEDYKGNISYKSWLKKQYTGPYKYGGTLEHLVECRKMITQFVESNPDLRKVETNETGNKYFSDTESLHPDEFTYSEACFGLSNKTNQLLERLSIGEILYPTGSSVKGATLEKLLSQEWVLADRDPEVVPITDSIKYSYWFIGDVQVRCIDQYNIQSGVPGFEDQMGKLQRAPLCISYDGLPLIDEVDDIGYCGFLENLHSDEDWKRNDARERARENGWTGYMVKPENLI